MSRGTAAAAPHVQKEAFCRVVCEHPFVLLDLIARPIALLAAEHSRRKRLRFEQSCGGVGLDAGVIVDAEGSWSQPLYLAPKVCRVDGSRSSVCRPPQRSPGACQQQPGVRGAG